MYYWIVIPVLALLTTPAFAQEGGVVTSGGATISTPTPTVTQIDQVTNKVVINWSDFSIAAGSAAIFNQPSATSIALNKVTGIAPSSILGSLQANGQVWILNPNGILFGQNATINVGALMASTLSLSDNDFMAGNYHLLQDPSKPASYVVNQGSVTATSFAALIAPLVENSGSITSNGGQVYLLGTGEAVLDIQGSGLVGYSIGSVTGQTVHIREDAVSDIVRAAVNTSGLIEAGSIVEEGGIVRLVGAGGLSINTGTISVAGSTGVSGGQVVMNSTNASINTHGASIDASGSGEASNGGKILLLSEDDIYFRGTLTATAGTTGDGGFIEVSAPDHLWFYGTASASGKAGAPGTILIDPENLTIIDGAGPGDSDEDLPWITSDAGGFTSSISEAALEGFSSNTNIILEATDSITIADLSDGELTMSAASISFETTTGNIVFEDPSDLLTITGPISFNAGGNLVLGSLTAFGVEAADYYWEYDAEGFFIVYEQVYVYHLGSAIELTAPGDISFGSLTSDYGSVLATAGGSIVADPGSIIDAHDVMINAGGNLSLGEMSAAGFSDTFTENYYDQGELYESYEFSSFSYGFIDLAASGDVNLAGDIGVEGWPGGITVNAGGDITFGNLTSPGWLTLSADGSITQDQGVVGGDLYDDDFVFSAGSDLSLIDLVINYSWPGVGEVVLQAGGDLSLGALTEVLEYISVYLDAQGDISFGGIQGGAVNMTAGGSIVQVGEVTLDSYWTSFQAGGDVVLLDVLSYTSSITADGDVSISTFDDWGGGGPTLDVTAGGSITQEGGTLTVGTLTLSAGTGIDIGAMNVATVAATNSTSGGVTLNEANALTISGITNSAGSISITSNGNLSIQGNVNSGTNATSLTSAGGSISRSSGTVTAGALTLSAATGITFNNTSLAASSVTASTSTSGNVTLTDSGGLLIAGLTTAGGSISVTTTGSLGVNGAINAGTGGVTLTSNGGSITQNSGTISGGSLTLSASTGISVNALAVSSVTASNATSGSVLIEDTGGLTVGGVANGVGTITISTTGPLALSGNVNSGSNSTTLSTTGTLSQSAGTITAGTLIVSADEISTTLTTAVGQLQIDRATGNVAVSNTGNLTIQGTGINDATGIVTISTSGNLIIAGDLNANGETLSLTAGGAITRTAGSVAASTLILSSGAGATLTSGLTIANLQSTLTGSGSLSISNPSSLIVLSIANANGPVSITSGGNLTFLGGVNGGTNAVSLAAAGTISQPLGTITAGPLMVSAGTGISLGSLAVASVTATNSISGNVTLSDSGGLTVGAVSTPAGAISITTTGNLLVAASVNAGSNGVTLTAFGGSITQSGGVVSAGALNVQASLGISLSLVSASTLSAVNFASGNVAVADIGGLTVTGAANSGGNISIITGGPLIITGNMNAAANSVSLGASAAIIQTGGTITAGGLTFSSAGGADFSALSVSSVQGTNSSGDVSLTSAGSLTIADIANSGGDVSISSAGNLVIGGDISNAGYTTTLVSGSGDITQTSGAVQAEALIATAAGSVALTLSSFEGQITAGGDIALTGAGPGTMTIPMLTAGGNITIANAGSIVLSTPVTTSKTLTVNSLTGSIAASAPIAAQTLDVSAATGITLDDLAVSILRAMNTTSGEISISNSGPLAIDVVVNDGGDIAISTTGNLELEGDVDAAGFTATLTSASGAISQTNGRVTAASLHVNAVGGIDLPDVEVDSVHALNLGSGLLFISNAGDLTIVAAVNPGGAVTIRSAGDLMIGLVEAGGDVSLTSTGGAIFDASEDVTVRAAGDLFLSAATDIGSVSESIAIEAGGQVVVGIGGGGDKVAYITGSSGDGSLKVASAIPGAVIRFNDEIVFMGFQAPGRELNVLTDREPPMFRSPGRQIVSDNETKKRPSVRVVLPRPGQRVKPKGR